MRRRHQQWFLALAERAERELSGADQALWLDQLEREHDNLRAALEWGKAEDSGAQARLRLTGALWRFWWVRGYLSVGRKWLEEALSTSSGSSPTWRAKALTGLGLLMLYQRECGQAAALLRESLALARESGDRSGLALALGLLGYMTQLQGGYGEATVLLSAALEGQGPERGDSPLPPRMILVGSAASGFVLGGEAISWTPFAVK